jgi:hypothetical protein
VQPAACCTGRDRPRLGAGERSAPAPCWSVEWHSVGHQVTIIEKGVLYRGKRYRSMSEVARLITGARWSGPRFFGLDKPKPAATGSDRARGGPADE